MELDSVAQLIGERVLIVHGPNHDGTGFSGGDIDCLVDGIDQTWALRLRNGWRLCQQLRYEPRGWYWVVERDGDFVAFDTTDDPLGLGRDALRTAALVSVAPSHSQPSFRAAYLTGKRARKGTVDPTEWERIGDVASRDPVEFMSALEAVAGTGLARILGPSALQGSVPPPDVLRRAHRLRWHRRFGSPDRIIRALTFAGLRYAERIARPAGLHVLLVGPDGAGKSTVASLIPETCAAPFKRVSRSHWRPGILPRLGAAIGRPHMDATRPHERQVFGVGPSMVVASYYWVDFLLGAILRDWPTKVRAGLLVRERGWWDLAVDAQRYRLHVSPRLVHLMGALLPRPDLVIVLEGDPDILQSRKAELELDELARQRAAWRKVLPSSMPRMYVDVSRPLHDVMSEIRDSVLGLLESRAISHLAGGWVGLPSRGRRWWLPRAPRASARSGISVYQPVTPRALAGWTVARLAASLGAFRFLPRSEAPPVEVRTRIAPLVPPQGTYAISRANHPGRYVALIQRTDGQPVGVAKIATDLAGAVALKRERDAIERLSPFLPSPLRAPEVLNDEDGLLVLEPVTWVPRSRPWRLDEDVARAMGAFFHTGEGGNGRGPLHGDFASWNILRTADGWTVVDWENGADDGMRFFDLCHYVVQSHALIGRPSQVAVLDGFSRYTGWIGRALMAYAEGASAPVEPARDALLSYLRESEGSIRPRTAEERRGVVMRRRLLAALEN